MSDTAVDRSRRAWLRGRPRERTPPRRPPWAAADFESACTRCGACLEACPQDIIVAGDGGFPEVDFNRGRGECTFCAACADACPAPAFDRGRVPAWPLVAAIGPACLARRGIHCQSCAESCGWNAISFALAVGAPPQPVLNADACTACGACIAICPADAIATIAREAGHE